MVETDISAQNFNGQKHGKKKYIAVILLLTFLVVTIGFVMSQPTEAGCKRVVDEAKADRTKAFAIKDLQALYKKLNENASSCRSKIILSTDNYKNQQTRFYYHQASTAYVLGKKRESKESATNGLTIYSKLPSSHQKELDKDNIKQYLKQIRRGTY